MILAFVTAVGGGITRDVIINEVPFVFKTGFYGTISLLIAFVVYFFAQFCLLGMAAVSVLFVSGVMLRMIAYYRKWLIPLI